MTRSPPADIGVVGLAVMGANLALNLADAGNKVAVYNRTTSVTDDFMAGPAANMGFAPAATLEELVGQLGSPRVVLLMVKAGTPVDAVIGELVPLLDNGDIIIDGGNSRF
ncbi:MAG: NAD(P)-binding domain-containing protein, partial [Acidimicrobiia bacterium]